MPSQRLDDNDIAEIIQMRGLGYSQAEIADHLGVSQSAIQYRLHRIKEQAHDEGNVDTYLTLLAGVGIGISAGILFTKFMEKRKKVR